METLWRDVRVAVRTLLKDPGFTAIAIATLVLGIGVNTSMFSLMNTILLHPLPYHDPDRLVRVFRTAPQARNWPHSVANFLDHRSQNHAFESMAAFGWRNFNLAEPGEPAERLRGMLASAEFFSTLGVQPELGRVFTAAEDAPDHDPVIVLSHALWQSRFAGDPGIVGRNLRIDGRELKVIGVMPPGFEHPLLWGRIDAWRPIAFTDAQREDRNNNWMHAFARLKPGVSIEQAQAELGTLAARLAHDHPRTNAESSLRLVALGQSGMDSTGQQVAWLTMGLTVFVLLIACANLANLLLARTTARAREYAIRTALGAQRERLVAQVLTESLLLSLVGGGLGLLLALWLNDTLSGMIRVGDAAGIPVSLDARVLGFALAISALTGALFGSMPAWLASRGDVNATLKQGGRSATADRAQHRLRNALIVGQVAMALILMAGAALFIRGLERFVHRDPGWRMQGVLAGALSLPATRYPGAAEQRAFGELLHQRVLALPGVERAAVSWSLPIRSFASSRDFAVEGRPVAPVGQEPLTYIEGVTPGYFATLGIPLLQGRDFAATDGADAPPVAIVNQRLAQQLWPGESPLGKRIGSPDPDHPNWKEIVGVVADVGFPANLAEPDTRYQTYQPLAQEPRGTLTVTLRSTITREALAPALRGAVAALDPDQPIHDLASAEQLTERYLANFAITGRLLGSFAVLGLLLAAVGIYGVVAVFVAQRTAEIGVRIALGAQVRHVLWLVLGRGLRLTLTGAAIGLLGAATLARLLGSVAPGLAASDPLAVSAAALTLVCAAAFASWVPAHRATRVDPLIALRGE